MSAKFHSVSAEYAATVDTAPLKTEILGSKLDHYNPLQDRDLFLDWYHGAPRAMAEWDEQNHLQEMQIVTFVEEFMTNKTTTEYSYEFRNGELKFPGWDESPSASYRKSIFMPGISEEQRGLRTAEYESWLKLEASAAAAAANGEGMQAILISPPRCGYSVVSSYYMEPGSTTVSVKIERVWNNLKRAAGGVDATSPVLDYRVAQNLMLGTGVNLPWQLEDAQVSLVQLPTSLEDEITQVKSRLSSQARSELQQMRAEVLRQLFVIHPPKAEFTASELAQMYYQDSFLADSLQARDRKTEAMMAGFMDEIRSYREALTNTEVGSREEVAYRQKLQILFNSLLVKAKVHFDEEAAILLWGEEKVAQIKGSMQAKSRRYAESGNVDIEEIIRADSRDYEQNLSQLQVVIAKDCGKVELSTVGKVASGLFREAAGGVGMGSGSSAVGQLVESLGSWSATKLRCLFELTRFECSECGAINAINVPRGALLPRCMVCVGAKSAVC